jgi:hypothetical protein
MAQVASKTPLIDTMDPVSIAEFKYQVNDSPLPKIEPVLSRDPDSKISPVKENDHVLSEILQDSS